MENAMTTAQLPPQVPTLVVKVKCGDDLRKFKYPTSGGDLMDLRSRVQRLYQLAPSDPLPLKYQDGENDWITLTDDDDLRLAMELEKGKACLKLLVEKPSVEVGKMGDRLSKINFVQQQQPQMPQMPTPPPQIPSYPQANPQHQQRPTIPSYPQQQQPQQQYQPPTIPSYPQQQQPQQQYQPPTMPSYPPSGHY